jgi:hypothetical protein
VRPSIVVPLTDELDESIGNDNIPLRLLAIVPLLLLWSLGIFIAGGLLVFLHSQNSLGSDSHAYWLTAQNVRLYNLPPLSRDAFLYSPAFADIVWPFAQLPWPVFGSLWAAAEIATFIWLLAPLGWRWGVPLLLLCTFETAIGNVYAFFALAAVLGIRRPSIWALPLLTKVTPGVAIVWFAVRREWRHLATIAIVTFVIVAFSFSLSPRSWLDWFRFLLITPKIPILWMPYRIGAGLLVTVVAAKSRRPWLLAPAMLLACPVLGLNSLTILAAIPRLRKCANRSWPAAGSGVPAVEDPGPA